MDRGQGTTMRVIGGLALLLVGASVGYGLSRLFPSPPGPADESILQRPVVLERRGGAGGERRSEPTVSVGYLGEPQKAGRSMWKRPYGVNVENASEGQRCTVFVELVVGNLVHAVDTVSGTVGTGGSLRLSDEISDPYGRQSTTLRLRGVCE
jgi:hypothetical protein